MVRYKMTCKWRYNGSIPSIWQNMSFYLIGIKVDALKTKFLFSNVNIPIVIGINLYLTKTKFHLLQSKLDSKNIKTYF